MPTTMTLHNGTEVTLPVGMAACTRGTSLTCLAYKRAAELGEERRVITALRQRADELEGSGVGGEAKTMRSIAERRENRLELTVAAWVSDPAPCTCA